MSDALNFALDFQQIVWVENQEQNREQVEIIARRYKALKREDGTTLDFPDSSRAIWNDGMNAWEIIN